MNNYRFPLIGMLALLALFLSACGNAAVGPTTTPSASMAIGRFQEFALPQANSGLMRPVVDHEGRVWFGEMDRNYLASFDPETRTFQQIALPHRAAGIMGVAVAPDDSIWFSEQYANDIVRYNPTTRQFQSYQLPTLTTPDPSNSKQTLTLPSAPNDLAIDAHGNIWFTEMNADSVGMLDSKTGQFKHYPLSAQKSVQQLNPYGITIDAEGMIWFTEASTNNLGRLDPRTGAIRLYSLPGPSNPLMEVASDAHGMIWATTFNQALLLRFDPTKGAFTVYHAPGSGQGGMYGLTIAPGGDVWVAVTAENMLARFAVADQRFTSYQIPTPESSPLGVALDQNQSVWFTESAGNKIGMLKPS